MRKRVRAGVRTSRSEQENVRSAIEVTGGRDRGDVRFFHGTRFSAHCQREDPAMTDDERCQFKALRAAPLPAWMPCGHHAHTLRRQVQPLRSRERSEGCGRQGAGGAR